MTGEGNGGDTLSAKKLVSQETWLTLVAEEYVMDDIDRLSAVDLRRLLGSGDLLPTQLTDHYLGRIERLNSELHAFTFVAPERAMERAAELEAAAGSSPPSRRDRPLWGMPFADKDLSDRTGMPTSYGSRAFTQYMPQATSALPQDMDAAGGVSLGKTNVPELGFPAYGENYLDGGGARNPWDTSLDPGGSSSGAASAVAARMLPFAPGSDAGGSVRIPAAATGLVGLKPTRGRVPGESGIGALAGLPSAGPLARSVEDTALLLDGMCFGPHRNTLRPATDPKREAAGSFLDALAAPLGSLNIGWNTWSPWSEAYEIDVDPLVMCVFEEVLELARSLGHMVTQTHAEPTMGFVDAFRAVWMAGAAGLPLDADSLELVEPLTRWLIQTGRTRPASDLPRALAALARFEVEVVAGYSDYDIVLTPALAMTARPRGWFSQSDGEQSFIQQCQFTPFTSYVNVTGLPAISLPVSQNPLPIGVQAIGRPGDESTLLQFGRQLQQVYQWQDRRPPRF